MPEVLNHPYAAEYVERMGLLWEGQGLPRIAGRILGCLALQSEPRTLDDLALALDVSKASVSTDARRLERLGLVSLTSRPGDRRDYYVIAPNLPERIVSIKVAELEQLQAALEGANHVPNIHPTVQRRLREFGDFHRRVAQLLRGVVGTAEPPGSADQTAPPSI